MRAIGILGAGTWGTALARLLANNGHAVRVWSPLESEIETLSVTRRHPRLEGMEIPRQVEFTGDIAHACRGREIVVFAVPSVHVRQSARKGRAAC